MPLLDGMSEAEVAALLSRMRCVAETPPEGFDPGDFCALWAGAVNARGYPVVGLGPRPRRTALAHRVMYEYDHGPIPDGLEIDHYCGRPRCLKHLEAVTHAENLRRTRAEMCAQGLHAMTGDNVLHPEGARRCRDCKNAAQALRNSRRHLERM